MTGPIFVMIVGLCCLAVTVILLIKLAVSEVNDLNDIAGFLILVCAVLSLGIFFFGAWHHALALPGGAQMLSK